MTTTTTTKSCPAPKQNSSSHQRLDFPRSLHHASRPATVCLFHILYCLVIILCLSYIKLPRTLLRV